MRSSKLLTLLLPPPLPTSDWLWDYRLVALHAISNLLCILSFSIILALLAFIYLRGHLSSLPSTYPSLWRLSAVVLSLLILSYIGSTVSLWAGGNIFWWTGANKLLLAASGLGFAISLWKSKDQMVMAARLLSELERERERSGYTHDDDDDNDDDYTTSTLRGL